MRIYHSDGKTWETAVAVVWEDLDERPGKFRAFWVESPEGKIGVPVMGGGCYRTIKKVVAEFQKLYPKEAIYRNGKRLA